MIWAVLRGAITGALVILIAYGYTWATPVAVYYLALLCEIHFAIERKKALRGRR